MPPCNCTMIVLVRAASPWAGSAAGSAIGIPTGLGTAGIRTTGSWTCRPQVRLASDLLQNYGKLFVAPRYLASDCEDEILPSCSQKTMWVVERKILEQGLVKEELAVARAENKLLNEVPMSVLLLLVLLLLRLRLRRRDRCVEAPVHFTECRTCIILYEHVKFQVSQNSNRPIQDRSLWLQTRPCTRWVGARQWWHVMWWLDAAEASASESHWGPEACLDWKACVWHVQTSGHIVSVVTHSLI